jgi:phenylpyruvate tautomerase PptA (4-oxalocrotonate tautomerase family)
MPKIIIEGPRLGVAKKRRLVATLTRLVGEAYNWPVEHITIVVHDKCANGFAGR